MVVAYGGATKHFLQVGTEIGGEQISLKNPTELSKAFDWEKLPEYK